MIIKKIGKKSAFNKKQSQNVRLSDGWSKKVRLEILDGRRKFMGGWLCDFGEGELESLGPQPGGKTGRTRDY